jgi:Protein of unknown function (DUF5663)
MDNKPVEIPQEIRTFLESLLKDAGMTSLDKEMHESMLKELFLRLDNFMLTTIVEGLPAEKLEEFTKMSEGNTDRVALEAYLKEHIPNATEVFARAMLEFRDLYLGGVETSRNAPQS